MKKLNSSRDLIFSLLILTILTLILSGCGDLNMKDETIILPMVENQITFSAKTHALDNNDNFSPDGKYLCYDTRATVYNENLANSKSIEKVNIETGEETILWEPPFVTGENTAMEVDGNGKGIVNKVEMRDISNDITTSGAHRGGTHRHEYSRSGNRIGFTYDDIIVQKYARTIGYMEENKNVSEGYTHYFSLILKPAEEGKSKPGEIEKAWDDSWVDSLGTMRAFIGKVRNENGIDYDYDIFVADLEGNIVNQLTNEKGYDAEPTVSPKGDKIVFTSDRSGDLELYTMNLDGSDVKQVTHELGYDGGAFFSPDGTKLIFRSSRPKTDEEIKEYKDLLANGLVQPTEMELYICNADGSELRQLTNLGNANWSPFFHPSGEKVLFSSNFEAERGFPFNLYMIDLDGKNLERVTHGETFDAFPVFSNDGKKLIFSSNRNNGGGHDTNLFIAEWQD